MTQLEFEWGARIIHEPGPAPDWIGDAFTPIRVIWASNGEETNDMQAVNFSLNQWEEGAIAAFRLKTDHPYYQATAAGFAYWPGKHSSPPADWDGKSVLLRNGNQKGYGIEWRHDPFGSGEPQPSDIIGYRRKLGMPATPRKAPPKMIDHGPDPLPLGPNDPPGWAVVRAWNEVGGMVTPRSAILALARYIERHEKPPVDPDVLAVRAILAAYAARWGGVEEATQISGGLNDDGPGFQAALETYRTIKANGGVPDVSSS